MGEASPDRSDPPLRPPAEAKSRLPAEAEPALGHVHRRQVTELLSAMISLILFYRVTERYRSGWLISGHFFILFRSLNPVSQLGATQPCRYRSEQIRRFSLRSTQLNSGESRSGGAESSRRVLRSGIRSVTPKHYERETPYCTVE